MALLGQKFLLLSSGALLTFISRPCGCAAQCRLETLRTGGDAPGMLHSQRASALPELSQNAARCNKQPATRACCKMHSPASWPSQNPRPWQCVSALHSSASKVGTGDRCSKQGVVCAGVWRLSGNSIQHTLSDLSPRKCQNSLIGASSGMLDFRIF